MHRGDRRHATTRALRAATLAAMMAASGCAGGAGARRENDTAALRAQVEELRRGQETNARDLSRLSGEMKALDAQSAFVVGELKRLGEEVRRLGAAVGESGKAPADTTAPAPRPEPAAPSSVPPAAATSSPEASPERLYSAAMASLQAEEYGRAVQQFEELIRRFPEHSLASNAQYWVGEVHYRQREFRQALVEFQKVIDGYPKSPQIPDALLKIGLCYRDLEQVARARESWQQVMKDYPGTSAAGQASSLLGPAAPGPHPAR